MYDRPQHVFLRYCFLTLCACSADEQTELVDSAVFELPRVMTLTSTPLGSDCMGRRELELTTFSIEIEQFGNEFKWIQRGISNELEGMPLVFNGRVCTTSDENIELRMVGESSARTSTGTQFCRVSAIAPGRACEEATDICSDPAAIRLVWNSCAREFVGAFSMVMSFEEGLCNAQPNCAHLLHYRASTGGTVSDCPETPTPEVFCDSVDGCDC